MIHRRDVVVEKKQRLAAHSPGNYPAADGTVSDMVVLTVAWTEENGGNIVEIPFRLSMEEAKGIDIGARLALSLDLDEIKTDESNTSNTPEST